MATLVAGALAAVKTAGIGTILSGVGTAVSTVGAIKSGNASKASAEYQAKQLEAAGKAEQAASQRDAENARKQARLAQSRARAVGAASGGGIDIDLAGDLEAEGEYNSLTALWQGEEAAKGRSAQAAAQRYEGRASKTSSLLRAGKTILGGGSSLYAKYS